MKSTTFDGVKRCYCATRKNATPNLLTNTNVKPIDVLSPKIIPHNYTEWYVLPPRVGLNELEPVPVQTMFAPKYLPKMYDFITPQIIKMTSDVIQM